MLLDFRKIPCFTPQLVIKSESVERVNEYKYLGMAIDDKLTGSQNSQLVYMKCMQRVYHLRILRNINIDSKILSFLYKSIIESILCFSITTWYGNITSQQNNKLKKIVNVSGKLGHHFKPCLVQALFEKYALAQLDKIMKDDTHSLNNNYTFLKSGRRLSAPTRRTTCFKNYFVPTSIRLFNHCKS